VEGAEIAEMKIKEITGARGKFFLLSSLGFLRPPREERIRGKK